MVLTEKELKEISENPHYKAVSALASLSFQSEMPPSLQSYKEGGDLLVRRTPAQLKSLSLGWSGRVDFEFSTGAKEHGVKVLLPPRAVERAVELLEQVEGRNPIAEYNLVQMNFANEMFYLYRDGANDLKAMNKLVREAQKTGWVQPGDYYECAGSMDKVKSLGSDYTARFERKQNLVAEKEQQEIEKQRKIRDAFRLGAADRVLISVRGLENLALPMFFEKSDINPETDDQASLMPFGLKEIKLADKSGVSQKVKDYVFIFNNLADKNLEHPQEIELSYEKLAEKLSELREKRKKSLYEKWNAQVFDLGKHLAQLVQDSDTFLVSSESIQKIQRYALNAFDEGEMVKDVSDDEKVAQAIVETLFPK